MLSASDLKHRQVVLVNTIADGYHLCVKQGNAVIINHEDTILTRLSKQSVFAIFVVGHCTLTSVVIDFCQKHGMALVVVNTRLRPIAFISRFSEANFLLRQKQHRLEPQTALHFARHFVTCKIYSHICLLKSVRKKDDTLKEAINLLENYHEASQLAPSLDVLMGVEGNAAKLYFKHQFAKLDWQGRKPRLKLDPINVTLDIGYTLLFNYVECNVRLFGFDVYVGMLHQLWFKRKSLICDFVEPFRGIVDKQVLTSFNLGQFNTKHFTQIKSQYVLERKHQKVYFATMMQAIIDHKQEIFEFVRDFYRAFMKADMQVALPVFDPTASNQVVLESKQDEEC